MFVFLQRLFVAVCHSCGFFAAAFMHTCPRQVSEIQVSRKALLASALVPILLCLPPNSACGHQQRSWMYRPQQVSEKGFQDDGKGLMWMGLEAQQRYFPYRAILLAMASQGYRAIIARYGAK